MRGFFYAQNQNNFVVKLDLKFHLIIIYKDLAKKESGLEHISQNRKRKGVPPFRTHANESFACLTKVISFG